MVRPMPAFSSLATDSDSSFAGQVVVVTGDSDDAGFDGVVSLLLSGSDGVASEAMLDVASLVPGSDVSYKPFGRAANDVFGISMEDVGQISNALVRINATGSQTSW